VIDPDIAFGVNAAIVQQDDTDGFARAVPENIPWMAGAGATWAMQADAFFTLGSTANDFTRSRSASGGSIPRRRPAPHQRRGHLAPADFCPAIYPLLSGATTCTAAGSA
jgi:hypothetical protein